MTKEQLFEALDGFGDIEVFSEKSVLTLFITGHTLNKGIVSLGIGKIISDYAGSRYPNIECVKNTDSYFLIVLKP